MVQYIGLSIAMCWVLWWHCDLFTFRNGYLMFFPGCCTFPLHCLQDAWLITWSEKVCDWMQILHFLQHVVFCHIQMYRGSMDDTAARALVLHQCVLGLIPPWLHMWVNWVSCWLSSCCKGFSVGTGILLFLCSQKSAFLNFNSTELKDWCFSL